LKVQVRCRHGPPEVRTNFFQDEAEKKKEEPKNKKYLFPGKYITSHSRTYDGRQIGTVNEEQKTAGDQY
jgi:hypothetical protein